MNLEELLPDLIKLTRAEKLRAIQLLAHELAAEDTQLTPKKEYQVWSPYDSAGAARQLMELLEKEKHSDSE